MISSRRIGIAALALYALCIVMANWFITHVGTQAFPGGPHTIPVGFGYQAPSGVLWIGLAFTVRDVVQSTLGKRAVVGAILAGAVLSYFVAPSLAWASAVAFLIGEALDFAVAMNQIAIVVTDVYGAKAYEARCLDCGWRTKRYDSKATAVRHARQHGREHMAMAQPDDPFDGFPVPRPDKQYRKATR